jgi:hypothetical protein
LAIVTTEVNPESFINTFVEQNTHLGTGEEKLLRFFEGGDGRLASDCGKPLQELFESFSALEEIEKALDGYSGPAKNRGSAKNVGIFDDHVHDLVVTRGANRGRRRGENGQGVLCPYRVSFWLKSGQAGVRPFEPALPALRMNRRVGRFTISAPCLGWC